MTPTDLRPRPAAPPASRSGPVLAGLAAVLALWLGLAAPAVSPVAPGPGGALPADQDAGLDLPLLDLLPLDPVGDDAGAGRGGRGRR